MADNEMKIILSDRKGRISANSLRRLLKEALKMFAGVSPKDIPPDAIVRWDITNVTMRSPLTITFSPRVVGAKGKPRPKIERNLVRQTVEGIVSLERGTTPPPAFSESAVEAVKAMVQSIKGSSVTIDGNGRGSVKLTSNAVKNADELAKKSRLYVDLTTIEGFLQIISVEKGNRVFIRDTLTGDKIECIVTDEQLEAATHLLKRRVAVTGRVSYRNHVPKTIHVEGELRVLREASELPAIEEMAPIDITGGLPSEEYVRRIRNG